MSISTVVTRGYGSFGSVNKLPTWGYGIGSAVVSRHSGCVKAVQSYGSSSVAGGVYQSNGSKAEVYQSGSVDQSGCC